MKTRIFAVLTFVLFVTGICSATQFNKRNFSVEHGLSSMFVLSLMQDSDGYLWAATVDGLNQIRNSSIKVYGAGDNGTSQLSGNLIEQVDQTDNGILWVHTNYGLDRFDTRKNRIDYFRQFNGTYRNAVSQSGDVVVITPENQMFSYSHDEQKFVQTSIALPIPFTDINAIDINANNELWIISPHKALLISLTALTSGQSGTETFETIDLSAASAFPTAANKNTFYYLTPQNALCRLDTRTRTTRFIYSFPPELTARGEVSAVADLGENFIVGFKTGGAVMLKRHKDTEGFEILPLGISSGVFSVLKDKRNGVVWLATDGEGVYRFSTEPHTFVSETFSSLPFRISKPVRAVFKDRHGNLWAGTKGDGIIRYNNYSPSDSSPCSCTLFTQSNSSLLDNSVYCFAPSSRNIFWIGGDGNGINYWSYAAGEIRRLELPKLPMLKYIHGIIETGNELWVATVGYGIFRISIGGHADAPVATGAEQLFFSPGQPKKNQFFAIFSDNDSIIWFGNRGNGLYRYNRTRHTASAIRFTQQNSLLNNDILAIGRIPGQPPLYIGTSMGLLAIDSPGQPTTKVTTINTGSHDAVNTVHAIAADKDGVLWATTNYGLIQYVPQHKSVNTFSANSGIGIMSYCDGAAYASPDGNCYFGGTNGFLSVECTNVQTDSYMPPVIFNAVAVNNAESNIDPSQPLEFSYRDNTFSIDFDAVDYWRGHDFQYSYRLLGASDKWIGNGNSERISFTNLPPGNYRLQIRYRHGTTESDTYELPLRITPPWYASNWAFAIYIILVITIFIGIIAMIMRNQRRKRLRLVKDMEHQQREDIYESKLRFFTNITHELCTPLNLISGSCQRLLDNKNLDATTQRFTSLIHRNSRRLNELIQELIEFRRIDTDHRKPDVSQADVSSLTTEIADNFRLMAEQKNVDFSINVASGISWPTDRSGFITIVTNLISNAFKYTPDNGTITISLATDSATDTLRFHVANSGPGIKAENISKIFDRYTVLERFERKSAAGTIERNGLGLAICHGLTKLLDGEITVESIPDEITTFSVTLPRIAITHTSDTPEQFHFEEKPAVDVMPTPAITAENFTFDKNRPTIFIVDDDRESLWLISDTLSDTYNIEPFDSAEAAAERLEQMRPDIVITDIIMGEMSGLDLTRKIKESKSTNHIPVIQLSSLQTDADKLKGLEAGADMYVTKPYNIDFIRSAVANLLKRDNNIKDYYESPISAFELIDGKLLHKEDKVFMETMLKVIHDNISNPELSTQFVADSLKLSVRNLYRRIEGVTEETPTVIIKKVRLNIARQLLLKTNLSIEEIIYKAGFNNRGTFFKLFSANFGCTPRQFRQQQLSEITKEP